jgi:hypothetical protein
VHGAVVEFALLPPEQRLAVPSEAGFLKLVGGQLGAVDEYAAPALAVYEN